MSEINLFDDGAPTEPELVTVMNISKYNVRLNGVHVAPGATGPATPADLKRWGRTYIKVLDEAPVDK